MKLFRSVFNSTGRVFGPAAKLKDWASCSRVQISSHLRGIEVSAPGADPSQVVLYFHGGGHAFCSVWTHRELLGRLSAATKAVVVGISYRLAPENPFPAGLEDALSAWHWAQDRYAGASIAVAGDSAGGNLAFALLVRLAQLRLPQPAACATLSPWLLLDTEEVRSRLQLKLDDGLPGRFERASDFLSAMYAQGHSRKDPLISPVLASADLIRQFPPVLIHVDKDEPVCPPAVEMAERCRCAGVPVELKLYSDTMHVFQAFPFRFPEAHDSLQLIGEFLRTHRQPRSP